MLPTSWDPESHLREGSCRQRGWREQRSRLRWVSCVASPPQWPPAAGPPDVPRPLPAATAGTPRAAAHGQRQRGIRSGAEMRGGGEGAGAAAPRHARSHSLGLFLRRDAPSWAEAAPDAAAVSLLLISLCPHSPGADTTEAWISSCAASLPWADVPPTAAGSLRAAGERVALRLLLCFPGTPARNSSAVNYPRFGLRAPGKPHLSAPAGNRWSGRTDVTSLLPVLCHAAERGVGWGLRLPAPAGRWSGGRQVPAPATRGGAGGRQAAG